MGNQKVVALSLFSGCGGLDIGAHQAGVSVLACMDFDADSIKTLRANKMFHKTKIFEDDIVQFDPNIYKHILETSIYDKFILIGGPPCQPFSKAGYWIGNDVRKKDKDPRNMVGEYLRMLEILKPDGFLFENVESMFHPSNIHVIAVIEKHVKKLGYDYRIIRANAADYGVPQKRKRIFIIGSKKKMQGLPMPTHAPANLAKAAGLKAHKGVGPILARYSDSKYAEPQEETKGGTFHNDLLRVPPGKNYIALTKPPLGPHPTFKAGKRFWNFLLKLTPEEPSWTIAAQPGPWVGPFHWSSRRLRVPEIAAIQTFPHGYKFVGSRRSIQKQIGNAVPPLLGKQMVEYLCRNL